MDHNYWSKTIRDSMNEPYQSLRKLLSSVENLGDLEDMFRKGIQKKGPI